MSLKKMSFKKIAYSLFISSLCLCFSACGGKTLTPLKPGDDAPMTRLTLIDGDYVPLSQYSGRTLVLFFWSSTCSKSGQLLLKIRDLARELGDRDDIKFITVSGDKPENIAKVKERIQDLRLNSFVHSFSGNEGSDEAFLAYHCGEMPLAYVIDPSGKILSVGETIDDVRAGLGLAPKA